MALQSQKLCTIIVNNMTAIVPPIKGEKLIELHRMNAEMKQSPEMWAGKQRGSIYELAAFHAYHILQTEGTVDMITLTQRVREKLRDNIDIFDAWSRVREETNIPYKELKAGLHSGEAMVKNVALQSQVLLGINKALHVYVSLNRIRIQLLTSRQDSQMPLLEYREAS